VREREREREKEREKMKKKRERQSVTRHVVLSVKCNCTSQKWRELHQRRLSTVGFYNSEKKANCHRSYCKLRYVSFFFPVFELEKFFFSLSFEISCRSMSIDQAQCAVGKKKTVVV
jgi:hypothetical protein